MGNDPANAAAFYRCIQPVPINEIAALLGEDAPAHLIVHRIRRPAEVLHVVQETVWRPQ
jgi:hypothetical protein